MSVNRVTTRVIDDGAISCASCLSYIPHFSTFSILCSAFVTSHSIFFHLYHLIFHFVPPFHLFHLIFYLFPPFPFCVSPLSLHIPYFLPFIPPFYLISHISPSFPLFHLFHLVFYLYHLTFLEFCIGTGLPIVLPKWVLQGEGE